MKFKVGDRVVCTENISYIKSGMKGTVKGYHKNGAVGVEWDAFTNGHDGNGDGMVCAAGKGWYVPAHMLGPISHPSIHITTDGRTTYAIKKDGKKVIGRAEAVCSPHDEFDFDTGAKLAFNRLEYGTDYHPAEVELKPANEPIAFYCVKDYKPGEFLTKGKTYTIERDGAKITYDDGWSTELVIASNTPAADKIIPNYLIPEVKRPAKVGEWVKIVDGMAAGVIGKVLDVDGSGNPLVYHPAVWFGDNDGMEETWLCSSGYVVLEGYQPEPEKPKYYTGKVVCVDNEGNPAAYTPGKVYSITDGYLTDDRGKKINSGEPVKSLEDWFAFTCSTFIEFKGE